MISLLNLARLDMKFRESVYTRWDVSTVLPRRKYSKSVPFFLWSKKTFLKGNLLVGFFDVSQVFNKLREV